MDDFYINGHGASEFSARLLTSWSVTGAEMSRVLIRGAAGSTMVSPAPRLGTKTIRLPVDIFGKEPEEAEIHRSMLAAALNQGTVDLWMPDGFVYRCVLAQVGDKTELDAWGCRVHTEFTLVGFQCRPLVRVTPSENRLYAYGTWPGMDCRLTVTVGAEAAQYPMAGVTWTNVKAGDVLVLDGLEKRILKNGFSAALDCDAVDWPRLYPGENRLTCPDQLTVEYYPTYQ